MSLPAPNARNVEFFRAFPKLRRLSYKFDATAVQHPGAAKRHRAVILSPGSSLQIQLGDLAIKEQGAASG